LNVSRPILIIVIWTAPLGCDCKHSQPGTLDAVGGRPPQQKNRCRTTIAERMVETASGTALYRRPGRSVAPLRAPLVAPYVIKTKAAAVAYSGTIPIQNMVLSPTRSVAHQTRSLSGFFICPEEMGEPGRGRGTPGRSSRLSFGPDIAHRSLPISEFA